MMTALYDTPKHRDLIFDIGLHMGEDTEFYLKKGFRVVAFEADPDLVALCRGRFKEFIDQGRLTIVAGAIVSSDAIEQGQDKIRFYKNDFTVWGTTSSDWAERNQRLGHPSILVEVDAVDFASVMRQHGVPHYMKVDIEGADMICINALGRFRERPDYVSLESDKTRYAKIRNEISTLSRLGYTSFQAIEQSSIAHAQVPPDEAREGIYVAHKFPSGSSGLFGSELPGKWKSKLRILTDYSAIRLGYYLFGDDGILNGWESKGRRRVRERIRHFLARLTKARVPGWYDTHARHASARFATYSLPPAQPAVRRTPARTATAQARIPAPKPPAVRAKKTSAKKKSLAPDAAGEGTPARSAPRSKTPQRRRTTERARPAASARRKPRS